MVGWDKLISRLGARAPAVRHVDCGRISETFDSDNLSCALSEGAVDAAYDQFLGSIKQSETVAKPRRTKGAATRYDSPARSLPIALYMGQS